MNASIITKYHGPTDTRGPRIIATARNRSVTIPWDYELDTDANHGWAADALAQKFGWDERGYTAHRARGPEDGTFVHVLVFHGI